ncbi:glycogen synthase GlgA [Pelagovum pacificum]|uniref:Glycogen synthase n=1 Tax=Pelagovum pacificum TaxID=2588711 RepID=A0A5C5G9M2_9RHOB|nr:glycogen synthase GlgA [Pelagovum pacificum]QQA41879.1 glycogen synthase GlgA [Pelagovum pacificum]TNY30678.1 glycogen synthase GlgA [Pelagovum pacificum]
MKVLSVTSECAPLVKTGGLADVAGALPGALGPLVVDMRTLLPGYPAVLKAAKNAEAVTEYRDLMGGPATLRAAKVRDLDLLILDAPHLFDREGSIYLGPDGKDWPDNPERFAALSWVAAEIARDGAADWTPDVVHCHDWQAALAPYYLRNSDIPTILTIHNIAFHGLAPADRIGPLRLAPEDFDREGYEFWGQVSALKAGLVWATKLTTVSPTYAQELMREEFGMGLDGVMRARRADLSGILNGIDEQTWNPATDPLVTTYKAPRGKAKNKAELRRIMGLPESDGPLCVVISRLTEQKGLDMLIDALPALTERGGQLALLGSGSAYLEYAFHAAAGQPNVAVRIGYDEALSHKMIAGGDAILVPSRFEPCGLTQLYGLRYGTVPVVALTGGLADTVINASPAALAKGVATGIQFYPVTTDALSGALSRLCDLWELPEIWTRLQKNGMSQPVDWKLSAEAYASLYEVVKA